MMAKAPSQNRDRPKLIRFSSSELDIVNDRARACGRPVACYIREVSLGGRPKATMPLLANAVIHDLGRIATRLCRLRDVASARALPEADEYAAAVNDVVDLIRRIE